MAAGSPHLGITSTMSGAPSSAAVQEYSTEETVDVKTLRDFAGITKLIGTPKFKTVTSSIRGYGDAASVMATITTGAITGGTGKAIEAKLTLSNEDFPQFDITTKTYENL